MPVCNPPQTLENVLLSESNVVKGAINRIPLLCLGILVSSNGFQLRFLARQLVKDSTCLLNEPDIPRQSNLTAT